MRKKRVKSGTYTTSLEVTLLETSEDYDDELAIEFHFSPEEKPQYYESRGRLPCPGAPAEVEVTKVTKKDGTTLEWDSLGKDLQLTIEENCWDQVSQLAQLD